MPERWEVTIPTNFESETIREVAGQVAANAPEVFGIGLETILGAATGGGGVALAVGAYKLFKHFRNKKKAGANTSPGIPYPRDLDEARQLREIREYTESSSPEYDAALGRIFRDEMDTIKQFGSTDEKAAVRDLWDRTRDRADKMMPHAARKYLES